MIESVGSNCGELAYSRHSQPKDKFHLWWNETAVKLNGNLSSHKPKDNDTKRKGEKVRCCNIKQKINEQKMNCPKCKGVMLYLLHKRYFRCYKCVLDIAEDGTILE